MTASSATQTNAAIYSETGNAKMHQYLLVLASQASLMTII